MFDATDTDDLLSCIRRPNRSSIGKRLVASYTATAKIHGNLPGHEIRDIPAWLIGLDMSSIASPRASFERH